MYVFFLLNCGCDALDFGQVQLTGPYDVHSEVQVDGPDSVDSDDDENLGMALSQSVWPKGHTSQHRINPILEQDWKMRQAHVF